LAVDGDRFGIVDHRVALGEHVMGDEGGAVDVRWDVVSGVRFEVLGRFPAHGMPSPESINKFKQFSYASTSSSSSGSNQQVLAVQCSFNKFKQFKQEHTNPVDRSNADRPLIDWKARVHNLPNPKSTRRN
jgi:hypothetical protein